MQTTDSDLMLLVEASSALLASPQKPDVLRTIIELAQRFGSADAYAIWQKGDRAGLWSLVSSAGLSNQFVQTGASEDPAGVTLPVRPLAFEDVTTEALLSQRRGILMAEGIRSMMVVPLHIQGEASGTVTFYWKTPHEFSQQEIQVASTLGNMAAAALGTAELYERERLLRSQAQQSAQRAAFLADASALLTSSLDYETTLRSVAKLSVAAFADWCVVDVGRGGRLERVTVEHIDPAKIELSKAYRAKYPVREDESSQVVFRTGKSLRAEVVSEEMIRKSIPDPDQLEMLLEMGIESIMVVPMVHRERTLGVISFVSSNPARHYSSADLELAEELARRAGSAIDNSRLYGDVRVSEERHRSLVAATTSIVWTVNAAGEFIEAQPLWEAYTGQTWEEHRGFGWARAIHTADLEHMRTEFARAQERTGTYEAEGRLWHAASRSYRHIASRAAPVMNADGSVYEWIGTVTDIHERKQAEEERKALLRREKQARYTAELLTRAGRILAAELDPQSLAKSVTDLATKLVNAEFGVFFRNVTGVDGEPRVVYTVSGEAYQAFANEVAVAPGTDVFGCMFSTQVFGTQTFGTQVFGGQRVARSDDLTMTPGDRGNAFFRQWLPEGHGPVRSYLAVPVTSRSGDVLGGLFFGHGEPGVFQVKAEEFAVGIASQAAVALDNARLFAESRAAQASLRRSNEELRRANEDLNQFAYSASHDLQEPLRMVGAYTQLLQKRYAGRLDENADRYIAYAVQGARRLEALLRDILAYTRSAGADAKEQASAATTDMNEAMGRVLMNLQQAIAGSGAKMTIGPLPTVAVAEIHMVQLFQNLIGNGIKYAGERAPEIRVGATRCEDGGWLFSVRDNGIGIDPRYQQQIFGLFKRLHGHDEYEGTGIGLAICQKIVERYGGRIWVESAVGEGAEFCFTLPERVRR